MPDFYRISNKRENDVPFAQTILIWFFPFFSARSIVCSKSDSDDSGSFTAALSCLFGITARMEARRGSPLPRWQLAALCAAAFAGSILGFKNVVSYVYPVCGYVGFFALLGVAAHYRFLRKNGPDNRQL